MSSDTPQHIAIILDGNRRWAKKRGMPGWKGHEFGVRNLYKLLQWGKDLGVKEFTLYCFSTENFSRPKKEVDVLMGLFRKQFRELKDRPEVKKNKVRINVIGNVSLFPKDIQNILKDAMRETKGNKDYTVNFALGYGGREEILHAAKEIAKKVRDGKIKIQGLTEKVFAKHLYLDHEPDLVIRPGGERRVSNYLLWQASYAEWFFLDKPWPEFTRRDLQRVMTEYTKRERRYGH